MQLNNNHDNHDEKVVVQIESSAEKNERNAAEKLERMNGIFDRLIVPMLIFSALFIICVGLIPKWAASCAQNNGLSAQDDIVISESYSFYQSRARLLANIESSAEVFEQHGYVLVEDENAGTVAYRRLESGTEIMDNLIDQHGNRYSVVTATVGDTVVTLMIYSRDAFLAMAKQGENQWSAVLDSENFAAVSSSDAAELFEHVTAQQLAALLDEYKASTKELF